MEESFINYLLLSGYMNHHFIYTGTVEKNWKTALGADNIYDKSKITESLFPEGLYVVFEEKLSVAIANAYTLGKELSSPPVILKGKTLDEEYEFRPNCNYQELIIPTHKMEVLGIFHQLPPLEIILKNYGRFLTGNVTEKDLLSVSEYLPLI